MPKINSIKNQSEDFNYIQFFDRKFLSVKEAGKGYDLIHELLLPYIDSGLIYQMQEINLHQLSPKKFKIQILFLNKEDPWSPKRIFLGDFYFKKAKLLFNCLGNSYFWREGYKGFRTYGIPGCLSFNRRDSQYPELELWAYLERTKNASK